MKKVFNFKNYRKFLQFAIRSKRKRGFQNELALAAGCQPSYFSQVLSEKCELTPDHAAKISVFLELNELETGYLLAIVDKSRAATPTLRKIISKKIQRLKKENENISKRYNLKVSEQDLNLYYSSWLLSAVHILISIPEFQYVEAIAKRLNISTNIALTTLKKLEKLNLAVQKKNKWFISKKTIHAPKGTSNAHSHLQNWRYKAMSTHLNSQESSITYTGLHSLSKDDYELLMSKIFDFIDETQKIIPKSVEETTACINIDFFNF